MNDTTSKDWVIRAPQSSKFERMEARFGGHGYSPHRHDVYAIGRTLAGVQSFNYRQSKRHSLPGGMLVLHPDEVHDGEAGTADGFQYRILYIEPALIQQVLGGKPLPFIDGGLTHDPRLQAAVATLLQDMHNAIDPLEEDDAIFDLAHALDAASGSRPQRRAGDFPAAERARSYIHALLAQPITLEDLERASGRDRWSLSRDFRAFFGTSPYRYITFRRLDRARRLIHCGLPMADAALASGFFDQSHMTRLFSRTFGVSPARWMKWQTSCTIVQER